MYSDMIDTRVVFCSVKGMEYCAGLSFSGGLLRGSKII